MFADVFFPSIVLCNSLLKSVLIHPATHHHQFSSVQLHGALCVTILQSHRTAEKRK